MEVEDKGKFRIIINGHELECETSSGLTEKDLTEAMKLKNEFKFISGYNQIEFLPRITFIRNRTPWSNNENIIAFEFLFWGFYYKFYTNKTDK